MDASERGKPPSLPVGGGARQTNTDALGRFYSIIIQRLALDAQHGGARQQLLQAADIALTAGPA
jgi:hypothetical protein